MGSPRKVLRDKDPKKLEAGYTLDKGTTYCDGLPTATVISKKVNRQLLALQWIQWILGQIVVSDLTNVHKLAT